MANPWITLTMFLVAGLAIFVMKDVYIEAASIGYGLITHFDDFKPCFVWWPDICINVPFLTKVCAHIPFQVDRTCMREALVK